MDVGGVDLTGALSAVAGAGGTGALMIVLLKSLVSRYIAENDEKHKAHADERDELEDEISEKLDALAETLTEVRIQMAAVAVSVAKVETFAEGFSKLTMELGAMKAAQMKMQGDVNEAFRRLKLAGGK